MTDDVMERLMAVQPLPRGERIARMHEKKEQPLYCLWEILLQESPIMGPLDDSFLDMANLDIPDMWRRYAAPLRKAREENKKLRAEILFVENAALFFQGENEELRARLKEAGK